MKFRKFIKPLRFILFGGICLVTLIALLIAEENLRGKWAWEKMKRDLEAKGENLDAASMIPAPVPNDQNLAEIPLFASLKPILLTGSDNRTEQDIRDHPTPLEKLTGYVTIKTSPTLAHSGFGSWQTGAPTDQRMWQASYRASFPILGLNGSPEQDIVKATDNLQDIFDDLRAAIKARPLCRFDIQYQKGVETTLPHLSAIQHLVVVLNLRATAELRLNRVDDAFADVETEFALIRAIRTEPMLISHLVRIGLFSAILTPIWEGIAFHHWTDAQLTQIQSELRQLNFLSDYCFCLRNERDMSLAILQWAAQSPRHLAAFTEGSGGSSPQVSLAPLTLAPVLTGWIYQNAVHETGCIQSTISTVAPSQTFVDPRQVIQQKQETQNSAQTPYNVIANLAFPALLSAQDRFVLAQAWANEVIIACAIEQYRHAHGSLPQSLDDLHLTDLPCDPSGGGPLHYKLTADNSNYVLYSLGWSSTDDGGKTVMDAGGRVDFKKSNWVWSLSPITPKR